MEIIRIPRIVQDVSGTHRRHGRSVGFVPTMGALHEGHLSLVRMCRAENDIAVVSIYVNPIQFGPAEDFAVYPRDFEGDAEKLRKESVDMLFLPDDSLMYPEGFSTRVAVEGLSQKLCGELRPGHFQGVSTVVTKLLNIVAPVRAYFGQKDFQQTLIIKKLIKDLNMGVDIVVCPTMRESDGLAMSSRNRFLNKEQRSAASVLYRSLLRAAEAVKSGIIKSEDIKELMKTTLLTEPLVSEIQYCSVCSPESLAEVEEVERETLLAVAMKIGSTMLIDNILVKPPAGA